MFTVFHPKLCYVNKGKIVPFGFSTFNEPWVEKFNCNKVEYKKNNNNKLKQGIVKYKN